MGGRIQHDCSTVSMERIPGPACIATGTLSPYSLDPSPFQMYLISDGRLVSQSCMGKRMRSRRWGRGEPRDAVMERRRGQDCPNTKLFSTHE